MIYFYGEKYISCKMKFFMQMKKKIHPLSFSFYPTLMYYIDYISVLPNKQWLLYVITEDQSNLLRCLF